MVKAPRFLALAPFCLSALIACTSTEEPGSTGAAGTTGAAGMSSTGGAGTTGAAGTGTQGGAGTTGAAGTGTQGGAGTTGAAGTGTQGGAGTTGAAGTGSNGGAGTTGAAGTTGGAGTTGAAGTGPVVGAGPSGRSAGCGKPPAGTDSDSKFVLKEVRITKTLDPVYLPGGTIYEDNDLPQGGKYDYTFRPYSVKLPKGYDPEKTYAITLAGGGCGGNAANFASGPGGGYQPDNTGSTIQVGLAYMAGCFDDGGGNIDKRSDTPEDPYVRAVIAEVQGNYCNDKSRVFLSGSSSGGWLAFTVGCSAADTIRAMGAVSGGLRIHRPACTGPQASIMIEGKGDTNNPIGPLNPPSGNLDSTGSAEGRDEILKRNGCVAQDFKFEYNDVLGNAPHTQWDPAYPMCVKYTGCPAAYPVVWCALDGGHQVDNSGGVQYKPGMWKFFNSLPSRP